MALPIHLPGSSYHECYQHSNSFPSLSNLKHYFLRPGGSFLNGADQHFFKDCAMQNTFLASTSRNSMTRSLGSLAFFLNSVPVVGHLQCTLYNKIPHYHTSLACNPLTSHVENSFTSIAYYCYDLEEAGRTFTLSMASYIHHSRLPVSP